MTDPSPVSQDKGKSRVLHKIDLNEAQKDDGDAGAHTCKEGNTDSTHTEHEIPDRHRLYVESSIANQVKKDRHHAETGSVAPGRQSVKTITGPLRIVAWGLESMEATAGATEAGRETQESDEKISGTESPCNQDSAVESPPIGKWLSNNPDGDKKLSSDLSTIKAWNFGPSRDKARHNRPTLHRFGSNRPPPSTPPDVHSYERLSTPTIPSLRFNSDIYLVEKYRSLRCKNPIEFDELTVLLKERLIRAKVERGGCAELLPNEYTVEYASRLDAAEVQAMMEFRREFIGNTAYDDSEDEEFVASSGVRVKVNKEPSGHDTPSVGALSHCEDTDDFERSQTKLSGTDASASAVVSTDKDAQTHELRDKQVSGSILSITTSGCVRYQTTENREKYETGEKRTLKTWIELTRIVDVVNGEGHEHDAIFSSNQDMSEISTITTSQGEEDTASKSLYEPDLPQSLQALLKVLE